MRYLVACVAALSIGPHDEAGRKEAPEVLGTWVRKREGKSDLTLTFTTRGKVLWDEGKSPVEEGWYKIDPKADPPEIDLATPHQANPMNRLSPYLCIYSIEGDTLTLYMSEQERPTKYEAVRDSGVLRMKLRRAETK
jgi:uncharacterized protein (TIGR03067 family)